MRLAVVALLGFVLAACETPPPVSKFPDITFQHLSPIQLNVREVSFENTFVSPETAPNVEHLFPVPPARAAEQWVKDRLRAVGTDNSVRFVLQDASVTEEELPTQGGIRGALTTEQTERYLASLRAEMRVVDNFGNTLSTLTARSERSITTPEDLSLREREEVWFKLTEDVMRDFDAQLDPTIRRVFFPYLVL